MYRRCPPSAPLQDRPTRRRRILVLTGVALASACPVGIICLAVLHNRTPGRLGSAQLSVGPGAAGTLLLSLASMTNKAVLADAIASIGVVISLIGVPVFVC